MFKSQFASVARFFSSEDIKGFKPRKPSRVAVENYKSMRRNTDDLIRSVKLKMEEPDVTLALLGSLVSAACEAIINLIDSGIQGGFRLLSVEDETWYFTQMKILKARLERRATRD